MSIRDEPPSQPLFPDQGELVTLRAEVERLRAQCAAIVSAFPVCRDCGRPALRVIEGRFYCDEWGDGDEAAPWAPALKAAMNSDAGRGFLPPEKVARVREGEVGSGAGVVEEAGVDFLGDAEVQERGGVVCADAE